MLPKAFPLKMMLSGDSETYLGPSSHRFFHKMIISPSPLSLETVPHWDIIPLSPPDMTFPQFLLCLDATGAKSWKFSSFMFSQHISRGHSPPPQSWQPFNKFSTQKCITLNASLLFRLIWKLYGSQIPSSYSVWTENALVSNFSCHNSTLFPIQKLHHTGCKPAS